MKVLRNCSGWVAAVGIFSSLQVVGKEVQPMLLQKLPYTFKLTFQDEFDGGALDTTKWRYEREGVQRAGFWTKEAVSVRDGKLVMQARYQSEKKRYITGDVSTRGLFAQQYGYWEIKVKLQKEEGFWSAFWLMPVKPLKAHLPPAEGLEIDIFEKTTPSNSLLYSTLHWGGYGKEHKSGSVRYSVEGINQGYHTIGLLWTKDGYRYFVDGKEVARMVDKKANPLANLAKGSGILVKSGVPLCHGQLYARISCAYGKFDKNGNIVPAWGIGGKRPPKDIDDRWYIDYVRVYKIE